MNGCSPLIYNWRYILVALPATIRFSITTAPCDLRGGVNCGAWCNALGAILFWSWYGSDNNRVGEREGAETTNRNNNMLPSGVTSLFPVRMYSSNRKSFLNFRLYPRGADSVRWRKITHFHEGEQDHGWWSNSPFELAVLFFYFIPKKKIKKRSSRSRDDQDSCRNGAATAGCCTTDAMFYVPLFRLLSTLFMCVDETKRPEARYRI